MAAGAARKVHGAELSQGAVAVDSKLVDDAVDSGLDVEKAPVGRGRGEDGVRVGTGVAQGGEVAAAVGSAEAADAVAAGVGGIEEVADGDPSPNLEPAGSRPVGRPLSTVGVFPSFEWPVSA